MNLNYLQVEAMKVTLMVTYNDSGKLVKAFHIGADVTPMLNAFAISDIQNAIDQQLDQMAKDKAAAAEWAEWEARMMSDPAMFKAREAR